MYRSSLFFVFVVRFVGGYKDKDFAMEGSNCQLKKLKLIPCADGRSKLTSTGSPLHAGVIGRQFSGLGRTQVQKVVVA